MNKVKCELFNDNFQNYKRYGIPKAQLVIADYTDNKPNEVQYACELTINELLEMFDDFESCCFFTFEYAR